MKRTGLLIKLTIAVLVLSLLSGLAMLTTLASTDPTPSLKIHAQTLELDQSVYINYYVAVDGVADLDDVELQIWTDKSGNNAVSPANTETPTATLSPIDTEAVLAGDSASTYVKFSFCELAAKQMTDTVYARAHVRVGETDYYSAVQKYSILQYAYNKLGFTDAEPSDNPDLHNMLYSMLAYGAAAQIYFDYATDRLASDPFHQITVEGGALADGCTSGLYAMGESLTITAVAPTDGSYSFIGWTCNGVLISDEATLTVTVNENATYVAVWASNTTVTVNDGVVVLNQNIVVAGTATDAVTVNGGTVIIEDGYYDGGQTPFGGAGNTAVWANGGDVVINGGYFTIGGLAEGDVGHIDLIYAKSGTVTVNGGFFVGADDTVWLLNCHDANYKAGTTNIIVTGGTFVNFNPADNACEGVGTSFVAEGYTVIGEEQPNGDVWYTVVPQEPAISNGIVINEGEVILNQHVVVDGENTDAVTVNGGTVIIEDGYYDGGQTPFGGAGNTAVWANGGDVVINGGYFTIGGLAEGDVGHIDLIYAKSGTVTVNGGFFVGADDTVWLLNCHDANYKAGTTNIIVTGGTFVNFNPADNACEGVGTSFVAEGYTVISILQPNGDVWYTVVAQ